LPAWANGPETLVIASSHSGNTEETPDSFETALNQDCRILAISTGGRLAQRAAEAGTPVWLFEHAGQPRAAVGFSFGLLLAALARLGLIPDPGQELLDAIAAMHGRQDGLRADTPTAENPAKRMAGQLVGYWVNVYGAGFLAPVARRWKGQINELAKAGAGFELLPEADHNMLAGIHFPEKALSRIFQLFLGAPSLHPRNRLRLERTRQAMMVEGLNTDHYEAYGASALAQMWNAIHFGDYTAFYLAMEYGIDPWDTSMLEQFKNSMRTGD
jgi:glucose/mannose-6-phosphate isomerase